MRLCVLAALLAAAAARDFPQCSGEVQVCIISGGEEAAASTIEFEGQQGPMPSLHRRRLRLAAFRLVSGCFGVF